VVVDTEELQVAGLTERDLIMLSLERQRGMREYLSECRRQTDARFDQLHADLAAQQERVNRRVTRDEFNKLMEMLNERHEKDDDRQRKVELEQAGTRQTMAILKWMIGGFGALLLPFIGWVLTHLHWV